MTWASKPTRCCTSGVSPPTTVPGMAMSPNRRAGASAASSANGSHVQVRALTRFVVVALVYSFTMQPVSR